MTPKNKLEAIKIFEERELLNKAKAEQKYEDALVNLVYLNNKVKEELSCQKD